MSSTLPTTRSPAPSANRISVSAGVRDTIFCGSAGRVSSVPSSSVRVIGNAAAAEAEGATDPGATGDWDAGDTTGWLADGDAAPPVEHAATTTRRSRNSERIDERATRAAEGWKLDTMRLQDEEGRWVRRTPPHDDKEGRGSAGRSHLCFPFRAKVEHRPRG